MSLRHQSDKAILTWLHQEPERRPHLRLLPDKEPAWRLPLGAAMQFIGYVLAVGGPMLALYLAGEHWSLWR